MPDDDAPDPTAPVDGERTVGADSVGASAADEGAEDPARTGASARDALDRMRLPGWVVPSVAVFWVGYVIVRLLGTVWGQLGGLTLLLVISMFIALAIEPGVNRLARRGWRRGRATLAIMLAIVLVVGSFVGAIGTLVTTQVVDLLQNSETYIVDTVDTINDTFGASLDPQEVVDAFNDPDGAVQRFIDAQQDNAISLSLQALEVVVQVLSVLLFSFYLVADGPRLRRAICSRLRPERQRRLLATWELAIDKTGGYLYSRALLALLSAIAHWIVFQLLGIQAPIALAIWVGIVSQFLPVVGTYLAGILPVLLAFIDSPVKAVVVLVFIVLYQQIENYLFAPRITARTMQMHPAVAFGAALAGFALIGASGAILALPAAAMLQAVVSEWGERHDVVANSLTDLGPERRRRRAAPP